MKKQGLYHQSVLHHNMVSFSHSPLATPLPINALCLTTSFLDCSAEASAVISQVVPYSRLIPRTSLLQDAMAKEWLVAITMHKNYEWRAQECRSGLFL